VESSQVALALQGRFYKPFFFSDRQTLDATFPMAQDDTDVYTGKNLDSAVMVDRQLSEKVLFGAGLGFRQARVKQLDQTDEYTLFYLLASLEWNSTDSLLDLTRGSRFAVRVAPHYDVVKTDLGFFKASFNTSHYLEIVEKPNVLLAVRAGMGAIAGQLAADIPADLRFYAGGGSIRGYPYQKVGPLQYGNPVGGRSIQELSVEFRF
jgi:translocation and assembly module TamA